MHAFNPNTWSFIRFFARSPRAVYSADMNASHVSTAALITRPIALVGLMGVGKSTIGRRLAQRLNVPFVDADHEIEIAAGTPIAEIFEKFGEPHFRDGERRVIARLFDGAPKVIATGGGAFMNEQTRALILEKSISVWIDANIAILAERVARRDNRPLLKGKNAYEVLGALAAIRNPIYASAQIHVQSDVLPHDSTVEMIMRKLP
jgi:shikimate kinase